MSGLAASPRPKLKTDVFGSSSTMDAHLDEEPTPKPRKPRFPSTGQKTPTEVEKLQQRLTDYQGERLQLKKIDLEVVKHLQKKTGFLDVKHQQGEQLQHMDANLSVKKKKRKERKQVKKGQSQV